MVTIWTNGVNIFTRRKFGIPNLDLSLDAATRVGRAFYHCSKCFYWIVIEKKKNILCAIILFLVVVT